MDQQIIDDLMEKVADDIADVLGRATQLVTPNMILPITNRGARTALAASAMVYDVANGMTDIDQMPTRESMVLATLVILYSLLNTDTPWTDAVAHLKKHFPNAKIPEVNVIDRRKRKLVA